MKAGDAWATPELVEYRWVLVLEMEDEEIGQGTPLLAAWIAPLDPFVIDDILWDYDDMTKNTSARRVREILFTCTYYFRSLDIFLDLIAHMGKTTLLGDHNDMITQKKTPEQRLYDGFRLAVLTSFPSSYIYFQDSMYIWTLFSSHWNPYTRKPGH